jgi:hypothetical protein
MSTPTPYHTILSTFIAGVVDDLMLEGRRFCASVAKSITIISDEFLVKENEIIRMHGSSIHSIMNQLINDTLQQLITTNAKFNDNERIKNMTYQISLLKNSNDMKIINDVKRIKTDNIQNISYSMPRHINKYKVGDIVFGDKECLFPGPGTVIKCDNGWYTVDFISANGQTFYAHENSFIHEKN